MIYDDLTNRVTADYEALLFALKGLYLAQVAPGATVTPASISNVRYEAHRLALNFLDRADSAMLSYASEVGSDASRIGFARDALRVLIVQNIQTVMRGLLGGQKGAGSLLKGASGGIGLLMQQKMTQLDFRGTDALGRRFDATVLVKTAVRHFAIQTAIDGVVLEAARRGVDLLVMSYPDDATHANQNARVSISGAAGNIALEDARKRFFHPNTRAVLNV